MRTGKEGRREMFLSSLRVTCRLVSSRAWLSWPNSWPISIHPSRHNQANTMDIGLPASSPSRVNFMPSSLLLARSVNPWPNFNPSISDLLQNRIRTKSEEKTGKEVTIKFLAAVAKENNRGSINSAQKAGRTAIIAPKPRVKPGPKPSTKRKRMETVAIRDDGEVGDGEAGELTLAPNLREKPGPKPGTKRKRTETDIETPSPRKLRKRA
jgi:hypothetical protein